MAPNGSNLRRRSVEERYRLLPYLYTAAEDFAHQVSPSSGRSSSNFPTPLPISARSISMPATRFFFGPDLLRLLRHYPSNRTASPWLCLPAFGTTTGPAKKFDSPAPAPKLLFPPNMFDPSPNSKLFPSTFEKTFPSCLCSPS